MLKQKMEKLKTVNKQFVKKLDLKRILIPVIVMLVIMPVAASNIETADSAYANGRFEEAAAIYEQTAVNEGLSAGLLYNLGNCYFKLGKDGESRVCYERALKLSPGNPVIKQNLNFLDSRVLEANKGSLGGHSGNLEPDDETFLGHIYNLIAIENSSNGWAVFAVMAFILFLGGAALYMFTPNVLARKTGFFSGLTFFGFSVIFMIFAFLASNQFKKRADAVLMDYTVELLQQPEEKAKPTTSPLHKGTKLKILDTKKGPDGTEWLEVKLNSENAGWLKKESVEII